MMFDNSQNAICFPEDDHLPSPETLKQHCLEDASLWVLKRRANLPYLPPQRLPCVTRGG